jgi:hypothetical protein
MVPLASSTAGAWPRSTQSITCCIGLVGAMLPGPGVPQWATLGARKQRQNCCVLLSPPLAKIALL